MMEEAVATEEEVAALVVVAMAQVAAAAILLAAAISPGLRDAALPDIVLPALASHNTKERFFSGRGNHFRHGDRDHFRHEGSFFFGDPFGYDYPYYGYDYPYYGYYDDNAAGQMPSQEIVIAVQQELTQLGYYRGRVDGLIGPQTERAIRWFQSIDKLPVTGQIDDPTLKALRIS